MNTNNAVEPQIEYVVVDDESNILDEIFNKLFGQLEKEIIQRI